MLKAKGVVGVLVGVTVCLSSMAQHSTHSPYTRFGYGELADRSFAGGRAMGGTGIGLRSGKQVNVLNPASYTAVDSLTFVFDFGVSAQLSRLRQEDIRQKNKTGNVEYIAMLFRLFPGVAVSAGLLPFSHVGYRFVGEDQETGVTSFVGTGGLTELYGGLSWEPWRKRLSIGVNGGYLFGNISHQRNVTFSGSSALNMVHTRYLEIRAFKWEGGIQYSQPLGKGNRLTVGAVYAPGQTPTSGLYEEQQVESGTVGGYTETDTLGGRFGLPKSYGVGLSFVRDKRLTVSADVRLEEWGKVVFDKDNLRDRLRMGGGMEYLPDVAGRSFYQRVKYRIGGHYANSYAAADMGEAGRHGYREYGVGLGLGLPIRTGYGVDDQRSVINVGVEYVQVRPEWKGMVWEDYVRLTLNFTFNEMWFYKLKMR
ncbi:MAG: hypothetical protein LBU08_02585 [Tannerellaceae bacterium]|jgi:hypothetical protein|nr:hypothetical protein [Tannerellaceae bacterium]